MDEREKLYICTLSAQVEQKTIIRNKSIYKEAPTLCDSELDQLKKWMIGYNKVLSSSLSSLTGIKTHSIKMCLYSYERS